MKILSIAVLACLFSGKLNALTVPNPINFQQPLNLKFDKLIKENNYYNIISNLLNAPLEELNEERKLIWKELENNSKFNDYMKFLTTSTKIKISTTTQNFDYHVKDDRFPQHQLRVKNIPESLGVDSVKQYSGYLDIEKEDKHFFFWTFESRNDPKTDPIILWLNGGPGGSSSIGLFFELGPSSIDKNLNPKYNPYSWNSNATVIFLDQPVNVGYSYSSKQVSNSITAGEDFYIFLELFFKKYPQFKNLNFHITGESYAGHYIPVFATEILKHKDRSFNLSSVLIGNGLTDPLNQYEFYEPMACGKGGSPSVLPESDCKKMRDAIPKCKSLISKCYNTSSIWDCVPATVYCNDNEFGPYGTSGNNDYDVRKPCDEGADLCYEEANYINDYLNKPEVLKALGVEVENWNSVNKELNGAFLYTGDWMKPYINNVVTLLENNIPVLIYAGDKDFICNWLGIQAWTNRLEWSGSKEFNKASIRKWKVNDKYVGDVKNFNHFTFLRVFDAGHMVPYDQPENSLVMLNNWLQGDYKF
ncbi:hypothetical protein KGF54_001489 [Candida jiufengensis]|uniref:uncharacterized protein n=1 Tax=Candida jiufengensis TaxID=497108 RepID=UPI002225B4F0|nr:uncharacterized protein KGF54_001489 [Candida jiufengensis]KAI5954928.1 hypothetical protein KGF54_001489 [Candida jiufengensis]